MQLPLFFWNFVSPFVFLGFWAEKGFSGEVAHDMQKGPVFNVYDDTRSDPKRFDQ